MADISKIDVVIVGGGISGMIAAVRLAQGGRRVVVLERSTDERYLCNSRITAGIWHCCQTDIQSDPEKLERNIVEVTGGGARPDLARAVARDGIRVVRWMQQVGVRFIRGPYEYQSFMLAPPTITPQGRQWEGRGGDVMLRTFESALIKLGGELRPGHEARRLVMEGGRVAGVAGVVAATGTSAVGAEFECRASHVVLADGGFQANNDILRGPISPQPERVFQRNARTGLGHGLAMARAAGAAVSDLRGFYGHVLSRDAFTNEKLWPYAWLDFLAAAGIVVGRDGRRVDDEGLGGVHMANAIAALPDPASATVIVDQRIWEERGTFNILPPNPRLVDAGGTMYTANTLTELAARAGLDRAGLEAQVASYNAAVSSAAFASLTPPRSTHKFTPYPIAQPPFHAFPAVAGITYTMGGISIDAMTRVLGADGAAIPGLHAVGCTTGGLEGGERKGYVGGLVKSSVTGLRAAEHILGVLT